MKKGVITIELLKQVDAEIRLKIESPVDPKEFFKTGEGIYVWSSFEERMLGKAKALKKPVEQTIESLDLLQSASDEQISLALGNGQAFKDDELCAIVAHLISQQPKGETGTLLADGKWNLFYTKACVVSVDWDSIGRGWVVFAWVRGGGDWDAGGRVFSPQLTLDS